MEELEGLEEKFIETNGLKLHTVITGKGEPIVLLHGFPDFWYGWKNIIPGLKDEYKLIIPDMRGYNTSDKPEGEKNYTIDLLVKDIKGLCAALNLEKVTLAGHDWGGMVAWCLAEQYPNLLNKIIILNAPHPKIFLDSLISDKKQQQSSSYIFRFQSEGGDFLKENNFQFLQLAVFAGARNPKAFTKEDKKRYFEAWSQPGAITAGVNYYRAFPTSYKGTGMIDVPTLVIWGMRDIFLRPKLLDRIPEFVKDLRVVRIEDSSHWILHDAPLDVIKLIKDFMK